MTHPTAHRTPISVSAQNDVREGLKRLPRALQLPLTYLTGKPYQGQRGPSFTPTMHLLTAIASLVVGLLLSAATWYGNPPMPWIIMVLGWMVTLHGARNLRMMVFHQCAHRNMWRNARLDRLLGQFIAGLLIVQNLATYGREHVSDHHALHHMTLRDPTVQAFLVALELQPGMTRRHMWKRIIGRLASPIFHARFALARLRSYCKDATRTQLATTLLVYVGLAMLLTRWHAWTFFAVAWLLPLVPFFQISNVLRLCVKHTFPAPDVKDRRGREYFASLTNAIFLGEATPSPGLPLARRGLAWLRWAARMALLHFPSRYLVLTGDTVCHDFHHRHPMSKDWPNYVFARQRDLEAGHPGWPAYREVWGLVPAINTVLDSLSCADAEAYNARKIVAISDRALFSAFDD